MISNKDIKRDWKVKMWKDREEADLKGISLNELYKRRKIAKITKMFIILTFSICCYAIYMMCR